MRGACLACEDRDSLIHFSTRIHKTKFDRCDAAARTANPRCRLLRRVGPGLMAAGYFRKG